MFSLFAGCAHHFTRFVVIVHLAVGLLVVVVRWFPSCKCTRMCIAHCAKFTHGAKCNMCQNTATCTVRDVYRYKVQILCKCKCANVCNMCQQHAQMGWRGACNVQVESPDLVSDKRVSAPAPTSHPNASPIHRVPRPRICWNNGGGEKRIFCAHLARSLHPEFKLQDSKSLVSTRFPLKSHTLTRLPWCCVTILQRPYEVCFECNNRAKQTKPGAAVRRSWLTWALAGPIGSELRYRPIGSRHLGTPQSDPQITPLLLPPLSPDEW